MILVSVCNAESFYIDIVLCVCFLCVALFFSPLMSNAQSMKYLPRWLSVHRQLGPCKKCYMCLQTAPWQPRQYTHPKQWSSPQLQVLLSTSMHVLAVISHSIPIQPAPAIRREITRSKSALCITYHFLLSGFHMCPDISGQCRCMRLRGS